MHVTLGKTSRLLALGAALIAVALAASACLFQGEELSLEEQAQQIDQSLMCPVCPGETIDQSQVVLAKQMRALVREKLAAGEPRQQILDYFVARFGVDVLAAPPKQGANLIVWLVPGAGLAAFGAGLFLVLRAMRSSADKSSASGLSPEAAPLRDSPLTDDELEPYLYRVDEEMSQLLEQSPSQGKANRKAT
ncbi:MAG: cytochrome c-type biogenesis protein CcmH [Dehalococcoidia bacterium]|nr:cytochrome c-type biogenesis protein CcmH [Dehalococcoidia bacterium]